MTLDARTAGNRIIAALPQEDYQRISPYLEVIPLFQRQILYHPKDTIDYAYFPNRSMASLVSILEDGATVEIGLVGNEGMVGLPIVLGERIATCQYIVQIPDSATRIRQDHLLTEFERGGVLQKLLLRYTQARLAQVSQWAICNRFHMIEERFALWMSTVRDCVGTDKLSLTQEFIAEMLGCRRAGVTVVASTFQRAGIIRYRRGTVAILDREALEASACECYQVIKKEFSSWLTTKL
ncbi:MAG: Crp/Fnr family transcriptional regulator [Chroococcidiopsidaceae cyanobacterium CP_BM_ER_R8_30]|nr:Crp/Fnr family transcriptional regulator [Chroococcidiopsidaceae cyanobacterium CP_BM_ER_R8_30]